MRMIRFSLNTIAQWPNDELGTRTTRTRLLTIYHYFMITLSTYLELSCLFYVMRNSDKDFIVMGHDYFNILMGVVIIQRMTLSFQKKYCLHVKTFVTKYHLMYHQYTSDFAAKEYRWINKICRIAAIIMHIQIFFSMMFFNIVPLWKNIKAGMFSHNRPENGTFVHSGNYLSFVNQYTDTTGYFIVFFLNFYPSYNAAVTFLCMDLLVCIMVFHIAGHLNILVHSLRNFPRPDHASVFDETSAQKYNEQVFVLLKDLIDRDQSIKEFMTNTSETFGISLCIYLAFHQVTGCVLLLECSQMTPEALGNYGFLTLMMFQQLIQTSVIFEFIATKSDILADEVYALPWELMDARNRKMVLMFLRNVQIPRALKAGGVVPVGVLTMSTSDILADEVYALPWELMDARNRKMVLMFLRNVQIPRALKAGGVVPVGVLTMSTSDILADEVYALPWELMDARNRKMVLMFLRNVQIPRALKAGGVVPVGVLTMSTIIKTSCSYFLMLKTLTVEE